MDAFAVRSFQAEAGLSFMQRVGLAISAVAVCGILFLFFADDLVRYLLEAIRQPH